MNLTGWLSHRIKVAPKTGRDAHGDPAFGPALTVRARVQPNSRLIRGPQGEETTASHVLYTTTPIAMTDAVWLPGDDATNPALRKRPLEVRATPDKSGTLALYKVWL